MTRRLLSLQARCARRYADGEVATAAAGVVAAMAAAYSPSGERTSCWPGGECLG